MKFLIYILSFNILFTQHVISTKEYKFQVTNDISEINILDIIDETEGSFEVKLIHIEQLEYMRSKKILIQECELEFYIYSDLNKNPIEYRLCNNLPEILNTLYIDKQNTSF